jgi:predicted RNase H-like HicB family nuclease
MKLNVHIRSRSGTIQAFCPELPGCSASAQSEKEAIQILRERVDEYFAVRERSLPPGTRVIQLEV